MIPTRSLARPKHTFRRTRTRTRFFDEFHGTAIKFFLKFSVAAKYVDSTFVVDGGADTDTEKAGVGGPLPLVAVGESAIGMRPPRSVSTGGGLMTLVEKSDGSNFIADDGEEVDERLMWAAAGCLRKPALRGRMSASDAERAPVRLLLLLLPWCGRAFADVGSERLGTVRGDGSCSKLLRPMSDSRRCAFANVFGDGGGLISFLTIGLSFPPNGGAKCCGSDWFGAADIVVWNAFRGTAGGDNDRARELSREPEFPFLISLYDRGVVRTELDTLCSLAKLLRWSI